MSRRRAAAVNAYNRSVQAYNQSVSHAVNAHMQNQINHAVAVQQAQVNAAAQHQQQVQSSAAEQVFDLMSYIPQLQRLVGEALAAPLMALSVAGDIRFSHVPHTQPTPRPPGPGKIPRWPQIDFKKAP